MVTLSRSAIYVGLNCFLQFVILFLHSRSYEDYHCYQSSKRQTISVFSDIVLISEVRVYFIFHNAVITCDSQKHIPNILHHVRIFSSLRNCFLHWEIVCCTEKLFPALRNCFLHWEIVLCTEKLLFTLTERLLQHYIIFSQHWKFMLSPMH